MRNKRQSCVETRLEMGQKDRERRPLWIRSAGQDAGLHESTASRPVVLVLLHLNPVKTGHAWCHFQGSAREVQSNHPVTATKSFSHQLILAVECVEESFEDNIRKLLFNMYFFLSCGHGGTYSVKA